MADRSVKLKRNHLVVPRKSGKTNQKTVLETGMEIRLDIEYGDLPASARFSELDNTTLLVNIQFLRWWYSFLRLALELEELEVPVRGDLIKVNRRHYEEWDVDKILYTSFDDWFFGKNKSGKDSHKYLFTEQKVMELDPSSLAKESKNSGDDFMYLRIPKRKYGTTALKEIKAILIPEVDPGGERERARPTLLNGELVKELKFELSGQKVPLLTLHKRWNSLILMFQGKTQQQSMDWINEHYAHIGTGIRDYVNRYNPQTGKVQPRKYSDDEKKHFTNIKSFGREQRKAQVLLHSVAGGKFP